jgi:hypothetical protein
VSGTIVTLDSIISFHKCDLLLVNARVKLVSGAVIDSFCIEEKEEENG